MVFFSFILLIHMSVCLINVHSSLLPTNTHNIVAAFFQISRTRTIHLKMTHAQIQRLGVRTPRKIAKLPSIRCCPGSSSRNLYDVLHADRWWPALFTWFRFYFVKTLDLDSPDETVWIRARKTNPRWILGICPSQGY